MRPAILCGMFRYLFAVTLCTFAFSACLRLPWQKPVPKAAVVSFPKVSPFDGTRRDPKRVGRIAMVNVEGGFVLIDSDAWSPPVAGTALKCMRDGTETGVVAVGKEQRGAFVAADIVKGSPQRGDDVFQ